MCDGSGGGGLGAGTGRADSRVGGLPTGLEGQRSRDFAFCQIFWAASQGTAPLEGFVARSEQASISAPSQPWKLVSLSVCLSAPWSDRSWEEAAGCVRRWRCVPAGPLRPPSRFQSHRSLDPREGKRDTAATAREESTRACPHPDED